ncbi:MAG: PQQ-binding-like beta-propeller repeat protein [Planctomycetota bacterium]|nr:PQQ-binding-like beta-propeller repeat protein [Planctomycetota bacterium]
MAHTEKEQPIVILSLLLSFSLQEPSVQRGVTILENRDLAAQLQDAEELLGANHIRTAVATLQAVLEADPAALIRKSPDDLLFIGASHLALQKLQSLPPETAQVREQMVGRRSQEQLQFALEPLNLQGLRDIILRYPGTTAGLRAEAVLEAILLDRGLFQRAAKGRAPESFLPDAWIPELPAPGLRASLQTPSFSSVSDSSLPVVSGAGLVETWRYSFQEPPFKDTFYTKHRAAVAGGLVFLTDSKEVVALDAASGKIKWRFDGSPDWSHLLSETQSNSSRWRSLMRGFDAASVFAPVVQDGILLAVLQEPWLIGRSDSYYEIEVRNHLPARRLYAFDASTGKLLWKQKVPWENPGQRTSAKDLAASPPAAESGIVYLPVYHAAGTLDLSLLALDLHSGEELWRTFLVSGTRESNLFGNILQELSCPAPAATKDTVYVCTNLGAVCAVDASSGSALWTRLYERTSVNTFQTGEMSRRESSFSNITPAISKHHILFTPTDSENALLLEPSSGELLGLLPTAWQAGREAVQLRNLVGMTPHGAFFNGTHGAFLGFPSSTGLNFHTEALLHETSSATQQRLGALARNEWFLPNLDGILRIDPRSGKTIGSEIPWPTGLADMGSLQALPGMLLILRPGGVIAMTSPEGALASIPDNANDAQIANILPVLENSLLENSSEFPLHIANRCEVLAKMATRKELKERLAMVASQVYFSSGKVKDGLLLLDPVLKSSDLQRKLNAAWLYVHQSQLHSKLSFEILESALEQGLSPSNISQVGLYGFIATTRINNAKGDTDLRNELLRVLLNENSKRVQMENNTLHAYAKSQLKLLLDKPAQRNAIEDIALEYLAKNPDHPGLWDIFSETHAVHRWVKKEITRKDLSTKSKTRLQAWIRDHSKDPSLLSFVQEARSSFESPPLPSLPTSLSQLCEGDLNGAQLLTVRRGPSQTATLVTQRDRTCILSRMDPSGLHPLAEWSPANSVYTFPNLTGMAFADSKGATLIWGNQWIRLSIDGSVETITLPGPADSASLPLRMSSFLALACQTPDGLQIQVRNLQSGTLFLDRRIPLDTQKVARLLKDGPNLLLTFIRSSSAWRWSLLDSSTPVPFSLSFRPTWSDLDSLTFSNNQTLILDTEQKQAVAHTSDFQTQTAWPISEQAILKTFSTSTGMGKLLLPIVPGRGEFPSPRLDWWTDADASPTSITWEHPNALFPQLGTMLGSRSKRLHKPELLVLRPNSSGGTVLSARKLAGSNLGFPQLWETELPNLPWSRILRRRLPFPHQADGGWLVPVLFNNPDRSRALHVYMVDSTGKMILPAFVFPTTSLGRNLSVHLLDEALLIHDNQRVILYGSK